MPCVLVICVFLGILTWGKCCFWVSRLLFVCLLFYFLFWSVTLDEERADWTLLASAVPSSRLKDDLCFSLFLLYSTLPNINSNFIPGSSEIFYDNGQILFGLLSTLKCITCNNKYDLWIWKLLMCFVVIASGKGVFHKNILSENFLHVKCQNTNFQTLLRKCSTFTWRKSVILYLLWNSCWYSNNWIKVYAETNAMI